MMISSFELNIESLDNHCIFKFMKVFKFRRFEVISGLQIKYINPVLQRAMLFEFCKPPAFKLPERHLERNQKVLGRPPRSIATLEHSGFSPGVFQRELEGRFAKLEFHGYFKTVRCFQFN